MGQLVDMNGYSDNGEVIVQIINYGDIIPEEDLPPSNNQHHTWLNRLSKEKALHYAGFLYDFTVKLFIKLSIEFAWNIRK